MGKREDVEDEGAKDEGAEETPSEETESAPKKKRKRRRKKKRPRKEGADASEGSSTKKARKKASSKDAASKDADSKDDESKDDGGSKGDGEDDAEKRRTPWIALTILVIGIVELFVFGSRGRIEVCVAMDGVHDFALVGQPRTEENTKSYPSCERRMNIGMRSNYEEAKKDAVMHACRRANMFRGNKAIAICMAELTGWKHQIKTEYVPPWDPAYRKRLFWFAQ